jgi:hypothetical protein
VTASGVGLRLKSLSLLLLAWISPAAVEGMMAKLGLTGESAGRVRGDFNASDGGGSADRAGLRADHELVGDHGNAYLQQNGGFIEHAGGPKWNKN